MQADDTVGVWKPRDELVRFVYDKTAEKRPVWMSGWLELARRIGTFVMPEGAVAPCFIRLYLIDEIDKEFLVTRQPNLPNNLTVIPNFTTAGVEEAVTEYLNDPVG